MVYLLVIGGFFILVAFCWWQNNDIVVTHVEYAGKKVPPSFNGFKILQVSDLHNKSFGKAQMKLMAKAAAIKPDIITVTGDLIDKRREGTAAAMAFISQAVKTAPVYYVPGNHEYTAGIYQKLKGKLRACGVMVADGETIQLDINGQHIVLIGIKDKVFYKNDEAFERKLEELSQKHRGSFRVLLSHSPEKFKLYHQHGFDLTLSGHAHGGQWRLPLIGGLYAPHQGVFPKYTSGLHMKNSKGMVVSRGLGNSLFPLRLFNRPELVVITLRHG